MLILLGLMFWGALTVGLGFFGFAAGIGVMAAFVYVAVDQWKLNKLARKYLREHPEFK